MSRRHTQLDRIAKKTNVSLGSEAPFAHVLVDDQCAGVFADLDDETIPCMCWDNGKAKVNGRRRARYAPIKLATLRR